MNTLTDLNLDSAVLEGFTRGTASTPSQDNVAAPFAEGGKARKIVELCARLHLPAFFFDRQGLAFLASAEASDYLDSDLEIRGGRLEFESERATELLEEAISRAVCAMDGRPRPRSIKLPGCRALYATVLDYPSRSDYQLLKVIVVVGRTASEHRQEVSLLAKALTQA